MADEQIPKHRGCGTMKVHRRLLDTDKNYARRLARIEEQAFRARMTGLTFRPGCTRIPVVVHVVWKTNEQNISQAQIDSQIDVLNKDFRRQNTDISAVPAPFAPLVGDARIEFELASIDPDGNPTNGVTRTETDKNSFSSDDDVKSAASGGADAWPTDEYLNIWVCNLSGGLLGYAQFPGGPADTDGVVVTHTAFGTVGTAAAPFDKGRTATHEIGHWLNLRHIWGDDGVGCSGSDFVDDTPNQGGPNTGKPSFPAISCSNGPNGDMFMNYMDYVDDDTMVMFTEGQIQRMQSCLDGPRSSIGVSIPCGGGKPLPKDLPKEFPKEGPKELPKELPKEGPKEFPKEPPKEFPKEGPKEFPKELPKEGPKEFPKDPPKEFPKEGPKEFPKELPKEGPKELPKDPPKEFPKEGIKEFPKDPPKDIPKDGTKDFPMDPGKGLIGDLPKSFLEPPIEFPTIPVQPVQPVQPLQPTLPTMPFVLATGSAPESAGMSAGGHDSVNAQARAAYEQILSQYASLYQRGMLDQQGLAAWQQVWANYRQLVG